MIQRPRLLACDLSLRSTGVAWTDHAGQIGVATIRPATKGHERLNQILLEVTRRAGREGAQLAVVEDLPVVDGRVGTGMALLGLHWLVRHALWLRQVPTVLIHNTHLKMYATGGAGSGPYVSKAAVLTAMQQLYHPHVYIRTSDEADAAALLALALDAYGAPLAVLPDTHRRAIHKLAWPALTTPSRATGGAG